MPVIRAAAAAEHRQQRQPLAQRKVLFTEFRRIAGIQVGTVIEFGMAAAREAGDLRIEALAKEVGYEDAGYFSRLFRRKLNLTPAQYRKRFGALRNTLMSCAVAG